MGFGKKRTYRLSVARSGGYRPTPACQTSFMDVYSQPSWRIGLGWPYGALNCVQRRRKQLFSAFCSETLLWRLHCENGAAICWKARNLKLEIFKYAIGSNSNSDPTRGFLQQIKITTLFVNKLLSLSPGFLLLVILKFLRKLKKSLKKIKLKYSVLIFSKKIYLSNQI